MRNFYYYAQAMCLFMFSLYDTLCDMKNKNLANGEIQPLARYITGADEQIRTVDLRLTKALRYLLCHISNLNYYTTIL